MNTPQNERKQCYSSYLKTSARDISQTAAKHAHAILFTLPQNTRMQYYSCTLRKISACSKYCNIAHTAAKHAQAEYLRQNSENFGLQVRMVL